MSGRTAGLHMIIDQLNEGPIDDRLTMWDAADAVRQEMRKHGVLGVIAVELIVSGMLFNVKKD